MKCGFIEGILFYVDIKIEGTGYFDYVCFLYRSQPLIIAPIAPLINE